jgi:hypothetical protein
MAGGFGWPPSGRPGSTKISTSFRVGVARLSRLPPDDALSCCATPNAVVGIRFRRGPLAVRLPNGVIWPVCHGFGAREHAPEPLPSRVPALAPHGRPHREVAESRVAGGQGVSSNQYGRHCCPSFIDVESSSPARSGRRPEGEGVFPYGVRQVQRLKRRVRAAGVAVLVHRTRGQPSRRRLAAAVRERVADLRRTVYAGLHDCPLPEKLREGEGLPMGQESSGYRPPAAGARGLSKRRGRGPLASGVPNDG